MNLSDFFHMGGYAAYVWPSYALALFVLVFNVVQPWLYEKGVRRRLRRAIQRKERLEK